MTISRRESIPAATADAMSAAISSPPDVEKTPVGFSESAMSTVAAPASNRRYPPKRASVTKYLRARTMTNIPRDAMDRYTFAARLSWSIERFDVALAAGRLPPPDFVKARMPLWKAQTVAIAITKHRGR